MHLCPPTPSHSPRPTHLPPSGLPQSISDFDHQPIPSRFYPRSHLLDTLSNSSLILRTLPKPLDQTPRHLPIRMFPTSIELSERQTDLLPHVVRGRVGGTYEVCHGGTEAEDGGEGLDQGDMRGVRAEGPEGVDD